MCNKLFSGYLVALLVVLVTPGGAIPIDNGVNGEPEIECGPSELSIAFETKNPFEGHLYVKGHFDDDTCKRQADNQTATHLSLTIPFTQCGVRRERSVNPTGLLVSATVVISFHPQFLTKIDRAVKIQCLYMEAGKTVTNELEVSELTTALRTEQLPMPVCRYEVLDGGPQGHPVQYAVIGQKVFHKWTCESETTDIYCMIIHTCYVDDQHGNDVLVLDENGCAVDKYVLSNLEYFSDLMAGRETEVFKFADKASVFFRCQIKIDIKDPNGQCHRASCPEPTKGKRHAKRTVLDTCFEDESVCIDVSTPEVSVWDLDADRNAVGNEASLPRKPNRNFVEPRFDFPQRKESDSDGGSTVCMQSFGFGLLLATLIGCCVALIVVLLCLVSNNRRKKRIITLVALPEER